ncbi:MAG: PKD domain-containing protein [Flavobacteriales bacterium]|jgi:hypothetical protein|nr:PKD domain-containing protein [Flavobacteriales bacterium]
MTKHLLFILTLAPLFIWGQKLNVLFLGNSYTGVNNLPSLTAQLATSLGDTINYDSNTPGGQTLQGHSTNSTSLNKIAQGNWDFVVLQDQSQRPSFPPSQVATEVYPYAATLVDSIRSANVCTTPLFYMTWGRENGDQQNCQFYTPICTYDGMQQRLRESYLEMTYNNQASVSPVGVAWKYTRDHFPNIDLYTSDGSHPSLAGSYLAACVFYSSMFRTSPEGATFEAGLPTSTASTLQNIAKLIVIDSLETWKIGSYDAHVSNITQSNANNTITFSATANNADNFYWDFGNGATATTSTPSTIYTNDGNYTVVLTVDNGCTTDTTSTTVTISSTAIFEQKIDFNLTQDNANIFLEFINNSTRTITFYDLNGRLLNQKIIHNKNHIFDTKNFPKVYLMIIREKDTVQTLKLFK